jgi:predicted glycoside hydrolase/deacetylase ChbG (UPF0249 family)
MEMRERLLIINADDFGYSQDTVAATIACFRAGVLSSATLMPNMPAFGEAAAFAREHPEFSYGLHLCLTDERPVSDPAEIPSLLAPGGRFWTTREFFKRALTGRIARHDVRREVEAQLDRMREAGVLVRHLDAHGHVHKAPVVLHALRSVLRPSGIGVVRRTQDLFYRRPRLRRRCCNNLANVFIRRLGRTTDHFLMVAGTLNDGDTHWWETCIQRLPRGVTEAGIHPGWEEQWRRLDMLPVLERGRDFLRAARIRLISFHELPGLARS